MERYAPASGRMSTVTSAAPPAANAACETYGGSGGGAPGSPGAEMWFRWMILTSATWRWCTVSNSCTCGCGKCVWK
eukprot:208046-Chlamydomonas_euryale.AAC.1